VDFVKELECQYGQDILMIRSDNGTEFKNYIVNEFLSDERIRHQYSSPYTLQQNGVAERKNRTLMDMARTMLAEFKSPINFGPKLSIPLVMLLIGYIFARA
jgi:transposase InsO family protein